MKSVFLIGPRACGKTSVGRQLAERLDRPFLDTDDLVIERVGMTIADYIEKKGWAVFRLMENAVLQDVCRETGAVIACGGGIVIMDENRVLLKEHGLTVYLQTDADDCLARLCEDAKDEQRPALTAMPMEQEVRAVMEEREPLYLETADVVLAACATLEATVDAVLEAVHVREGQ